MTLHVKAGRDLKIKRSGVISSLLVVPEVLSEVAVGSVGPAANAAVGNVGDSIGQEYIPTVRNKKVDKIKVTFWTTPTAGTYRIGIFGASAAPLAYVDVVNPPSGDCIVELPAQFEMVVGTTYYVGMRNVGGLVSQAGFNFTGAVSVGGTSAQCAFGTNFGSASSAFELPFTLYDTFEFPGVYTVQEPGWGVYDLTGATNDGDDQFGVGHAWIYGPAGGAAQATGKWAVAGGDGTIVRTAGSLSGNWPGNLIDVQLGTTQWFGYDILRGCIIYKDGVEVINFMADWPLVHP